MQIVITEWALNSYLQLKYDKAFTSREYWEKIRPDVLLLKQYPDHQKFDQDKFWSQEISNGYKMKWHNIGHGKVQIRLPVSILSGNLAYLCEAYVKESPKYEQRRLARFKTHLQLIQKGRFTERGRLS